MIEITNPNRFPVPLTIKARRINREGKHKNLTVFIVPGLGAGKNVRYLSEELSTPWVDRAKNDGFIRTRIIPDDEFEALQKGE